MSNLTKGLILLLVVLGIGAGLVVWKNKVGAGHVSAASFNSISKDEIELLLRDLAKVNPMVLKRFEQDPEMKKQQLENLKQLLAFALLLAPVPAAATVSVETANGDWSQLPALHHRGYDHLSTKMMQKLFEISSEGKCVLPGRSGRMKKELNLSLSFAATQNEGRWPGNGGMAKVAAKACQRARTF